MKLVNFASLDPALRLRGIKGMPGVGKLGHATGDEFHADLNEVVPATGEAVRALFGAGADSDLEVIPREGVRFRRRPPSSATESFGMVKQRRGQVYFRDAVIRNCGGVCSATGLAIRQLLVASHILPWGSHPEYRFDVRNGLSLSRLHDAAFDCGLIAFDRELRMLLSPQLKTELSQRAVAENFGASAGQPLHVPDDAVLPELTFLDEHRVKKFRKS